jgi:hypothetical protein
MAKQKKNEEQDKEKRVSGVADRRVTIRDRRPTNRVIGEVNPRRKRGDRRETKL